MCKHPEQTPDGKYRGVIYERKNKITGKSYVGKTKNEKTRKQSWNNRSNNSYGGEKITDARKQYGIGPDVWDYSVLEEVFTDTQEEMKAQLKERETSWIKEKDAVNNGYCGAYGDGNLGSDYDEERKKKCGNAMRGKHHSNATKAKLSPKNKGRHHTKEAKAKISKKLKGIKRTDAQKKAQSLRQKGKVPIAATAAAKEWVKQNGAYWKNHPISDEAKANMKKAQQARGTDTIATWPEGHEETFPTMLDASKATGVAVGSIHYSITNNTKTKDGYKFRKAS